MTTREGSGPSTMAESVADELRAGRRVSFGKIEALCSLRGADVSHHQRVTRYEFPDGSAIVEDYAWGIGVHASRIDAAQAHLDRIESGRGYPPAGWITPGSIPGMGNQWTSPSGEET